MTTLVGHPHSHAVCLFGNKGVAYNEVFPTKIKHNSHTSSIETNTNFG